MRCPILVWAVLASFVAAAPLVHAGALERFEKAHRPSSDRDEGSKSSSRDDDESETDTSSDDWSDWDSGSSGDDDGDTSELGSAVGLFVLCAIPPLTFACMHPPYRLARTPYDDEGRYIQPVASASDGDEDGASTRFYLRAQQERFRWAELGLSGFRAFNEPVVYSHDLELTAWLGPVVSHLRWEHFYERIEESDEWDHLDRFGLHVGSNVTGPWIDFLETYLLAGVGVLRREAWTFAFEALLDVRIYPVEPLVLRPSATLSVFAIGPVLLDLRTEVGVALGPLEIRLGPRWLTQGSAQGFWGPSAAVTARF